MENTTATWILDDSFLVPGYVSVASFKKHLDVPVDIYYSGQQLQEVARVFDAIGSNISVHPVPQEIAPDGIHDAHIQNRLVRFELAAQSANQTVLMIDADTAFNEGIKKILDTLESEKAAHPDKALVCGVIEYEHAKEAWLYFHRKDSDGKDMTTPMAQKQRTFAQVFGPDWERLLDGPQFNNGFLVLHNAAAVANAWKSFYLKGLHTELVNPMDDQVPLAAALVEQPCRAVSLPATFNSQGHRSGSYSGFHLWAGRWKTELLDVEEGVAHLSDYASIAAEFWEAIPRHWKQAFAQNATREPNQFRDIDGIHCFEDICEEVIVHCPTGHVVEVGTYKGRHTCFLAELVNNSGKSISIDSIDNYVPDGISKAETEDNLQKAGMADFVQLIEADSVTAAKLYEPASLDFVLLDGPQSDDAFTANLRSWYSKLKAGGTIAGTDQSLIEQASGSNVLKFCKNHGISPELNGTNFTFKKPVNHIPLAFHFCWFRAGNGAVNKPFSYIHYLCLLSVMKQHPDATFNFYYNSPIESEWFELLKPHLQLAQVEAPTEIYGQPLKKVEHQSDIFRFRKLLREGGIYLDLDVFCIKPFDSLLGEHFVMGIEAQSGLCNAVILSEPQAPFLQTWLESYHPDCTREGAGFDPDGWAEMSVHFPQKLANELSDCITVLPPKAFFYPIGIPTLLERFFNDRDFEPSSSYCHHLWESQSWEGYLKDLDPEKVMAQQGFFYQLVKSHLTTDEIRGTHKKKSVPLLQQTLVTKS